ncbi:MAG: energy-coupled thiamine transporter ThiT [Oscillospiraceae bacterium]|nr:energy-coupled thiamine transporter ThiT [Oscillospiraceae bacterium]
MTSNIKLRRLCEGAIFLAASVALSFIRINPGLAYGGSIDLAMLPLVFFAVRWGLPWGLCAGFLFGLMHFLFSGGVAVNWQSMLLDYSVAYMMTGLAGALKNRKLGLPLGGLLGCVGRFGIHFISGITIYAAYMPEEFLNRTMTSTWMYSLLYNGLYMLPNTIIVVVIGALLSLPLQKFIMRDDIR